MWPEGGPAVPPTSEAKVLFPWGRNPDVGLGEDGGRGSEGSHGAEVRGRAEAKPRHLLLQKRSSQATVYITLTR
jgi:hypothetical protein